MKTAPAPFESLLRFVQGRDALSAPPWPAQTFGLLSAEQDETAQLAATVLHGDDARLITVRITNAVTLDAGAFVRSTTYAYNTIRSQLGKLHPVRFWNHIPAIHAVMDSERDRYMVFNAGRFHAFESWYGSTAAFSRHVATASGVGHWGRDLVIHCLATQEAG